MFGEIVQVKFLKEFELSEELFFRGEISTGDIHHGGVFCWRNFQRGNFPQKKLSIGGEGRDFQEKCFR